MLPLSGLVRIVFWLVPVLLLVVSMRTVEFEPELVTDPPFVMVMLVVPPVEVRSNTLKTLLCLVIGWDSVSP